MPEFSLSVIIVSYNTLQLLLECLDSLVDATAGMSVETWVVDNASTDGSADAVQAAFPNVNVIRNDRNLGFAGANNEALKKVDGEILILLNPDTLVMPGGIQAFETAFQCPAEIGIVGPQILNADGTQQPSCGKFASLWSEFLFQTFLFKIIPSPFPLGNTIDSLWQKEYQIRHPVDWVTGACLAIRKAVVEKIGLLDEGFFMYGEDMEWCWRANNAGYMVLYEPSAKVTHYSRQSSKNDYRSWIVRYTSGQLRFIRKTHSTIYLAIFGLLISLGSILRLFIWILYSLVDNKRHIEAQQRINGYCDAFILGLMAVWNK